MSGASTTPESATRPERETAAAVIPPAGGFRGVVTFRRMEAVSLFHSLVYLGLLTCAFLLDGPQPFTFILGLSHGLIWIGMAITSIFAVHFRVINLRLAVAVVLLGCVAPFFGSIEFLRQSRQHRRKAGRDVG